MHGGSTGSRRCVLIVQHPSRLLLRLLRLVADLPLMLFLQAMARFGAAVMAFHTRLGLQLRHMLS